MATFNNILVPVDLSRSCETAFKLARDMTEDPDAELTCLFVLSREGEEVSSFRKMFKEAGSDQQVIDNYAMPKLQDWVEDQDWTAREEVNLEVTIGDPVEEIIQIAEENAHDLVVMGTHGRSGFQRYWIGSVAEQTVRTCPIPVMVVRPGDNLAGALDSTIN